MNHSLLKPHLTEKSMHAASRGVYTFVIDRKANKHQVKKLVEELFQVQVTRVTTLTTTLPARRTGRKRLPTPTTPLKLARVWLGKNQSLSLFDLPAEG